MHLVNWNTLKKSGENISQNALQWNPHEQRDSGSPRKTWSRNVTKDMVDLQLSWNELRQYKAQDILNPDCRRKKKRAYHKYKKNIAMTDCLVILNSA